MAIRFYKTNLPCEEAVWRQVRREWRRDPIRQRHLKQLMELRYAAMLGQCDLWFAWDDEARHHEWTGPRHCLGLVVTVLDGTVLVVQFATGIRLQSWLPLACRELLKFAKEQSCTELSLYARQGWKQEVSPLAWTLPVLIRRDLETLRVAGDRSSASRAAVA